MRQVSLVLLAAICVASVAARCEMTPHRTIVGSDVAPSKPVSSAQHCGELCATTQGCRAAVYDPLSGHCFSKSASATTASAHPTHTVVVPTHGGRHGITVQDHGCPTPFSATMTFNSGACPTSYLGVQCWTPSRAPTAQDSLLFPKGTNVQFSSPDFGTYTPLLASSIQIESGATVTFLSGGIVISQCLNVDGTLNLNSSTWQAGAGPSSGVFPPDPSVPLESCAQHYGGFTPRVCGPGTVYVAGSVVVQNYYSSLWAPTIVRMTGSLNVNTGGYLWANVTSFGTLQLNRISYFQGAISNYGDMELGGLEFAEVDTSNSKIAVDNYGRLRFRSCTYGTGVNSTFTNFGVLYFGYEACGTYNTEYVTTIFNAQDGIVMWVSNNGWYPMSYQMWASTVYNAGTLVADGVGVYAGHMYNLGGNTFTYNSGSFEFGNGAGLAPQAEWRDCLKIPVEVQLPPAPPQAEKKSHGASKLSSAGQACKTSDDCAGDACCTNSVCQPNACIADMCCPNNEMCTPYTSVVYCGAYLPPQSQHTQQDCDSGIAVRPLPDSFSKKLPPMSLLKSRYTFQSGVIVGDGTGSITTTEPIYVTGDLKVSYTKWFALSEFGTAPFFGGGTVRIGKNATLALGLSSGIHTDGNIIVEDGGQLHVPFHTTLTITNHSIRIERGGRVQVDGSLVLGKGVRLQRCGRLSGPGSVVADVASLADC